MHFASGRVANIHVSWLDVHKERKMVVVGSRGMLVFDDMLRDNKLCFHAKLAERLTKGGTTTFHVHAGDGEPIPISSEPPLTREVRHFAESILHDSAPRSDGRDGLRVVRILDQADRQLALNRGDLSVVRIRKEAKETLIYD
jgi:UDP-2-acetamido-3-amino-2,3-dideoxy-glucuronate N-acetyltransferase